MTKKAEQKPAKKKKAPKAKPKPTAKPKSKKPPKKKKPPVVLSNALTDTKPLGTLAGARTLSKLVAPDESTDNQMRSRFAAGLFYQTRLDDMSIVQMSQHPSFAHIPLQTLYAWSAEDCWVERRKAMLEQWRTKIGQQIASTLVQTQKKDLENLERVIRGGFDKLIYDPVEARSWEGVAGALTKLLQLANELRVSMAENINPVKANGTMAGNPIAQLAPQVSEDEARQAAKLLIQQRREAIRKGGKVDE